MIEEIICFNTDIKPYNGLLVRLMIKSRALFVQYRSLVQGHKAHQELEQSQDKTMIVKWILGKGVEIHSVRASISLSSTDQKKNSNSTHFIQGFESI